MSRRPRAALVESLARPCRRRSSRRHRAAQADLELLAAGASASANTASRAAGRNCSNAATPNPPPIAICGSKMLTSEPIATPRWWPIGSSAGCRCSIRSRAVARGPISARATRVAAVPEQYASTCPRPAHVTTSLLTTTRTPRTRLPPARRRRPPRRRRRRHSSSLERPRPFRSRPQVLRSAPAPD